MRAAVLREPGPAENLRLEDVDDPTPGPGEVVVRLRAAALNHRDVWIRSGTGAYAGGFRQRVILGSDGAGEVAAVGAGADPALVGRAVVINPSLDWGDDGVAQGPEFRILGLPDDGTYAQRIRVPARNVHPKPAALSFEEAAALPLAGLTAYRAVVSRAQVRAGETVLVTGIGGGVSTFALQIAARRGARVLVTSGSDAKLARGARARRGGRGQLPHPGLGEGDPRAHRRPRARRGHRQRGRRDLRARGGPAAAGRAHRDLRRHHAARCGSSSCARCSGGRSRCWAPPWGARPSSRPCCELYARDGLRPVVDRVFPLADAAAAHRRMEEAGQFGKIVLSAA